MLQAKGSIYLQSVIHNTLRVCHWVSFSEASAKRMWLYGGERRVGLGTKMITLSYEPLPSLTIAALKLTGCTKKVELL